VFGDRGHVVELSTGYLTYEQLDAEVLAIADDFRSFGVGMVHVTFGFGCQVDRLVQTEDVPVPTSRFAQFIADCEADETYDLGEANLHVRGGGVEFLLCHERDVHCSGEDGPLLLAVRKRWAREYERSHERRSGGRWHRLAGRPRDTREI
jgi:hypothetical protein